MVECAHLDITANPNKKRETQQTKRGERDRALKKSTVLIVIAKTNEICEGSMNSASHHTNHKKEYHHNRAKIQ